MAVASLILGIFSIFAAIGGVGTVMVPYLGSFLSFLAPLVALAGVILGGVGLSQANRSGEATGLAMAGLIVSGVAFLPALLLALTCGMCNAACSNNAARTGGGVFSIFDGGVPPPNADTSTRSGAKPTSWSLADPCACTSGRRRCRAGGGAPSSIPAASH